MFTRMTMPICKICNSNTTLNDDGICEHCKILQGTLTRVCSKCKRELPLLDFYPDKDKWDGYKMTCIECYSKYYSKRVKDD